MGPQANVLAGVSATEPRAAAALAQEVENLQDATQIAHLMGGREAGIDHRVGGASPRGLTDTRMGGV